MNRSSWNNKARPLQDCTTTWALVPIKNFARAKSRLATVLSAEQCAALATCMATDVIAALRGCADVGRVVCLGEQPEIETFATQQGCEFVAERSGAGLSANLDHAARSLQENGARSLLIVPGDLPLIAPADVSTLLKKHRDGMTICPAGRDGGTNALVISPPTAIGFLFGEQSCERHCRAAEAAGLQPHIVEVAAFSHDIDQPTDLEQLCRLEVHGHTGRYLEQADIRAAFSLPPSAALA